MLPKKYQVIGDGKTAYPLPDGRNIVVPAGYKLYFNPDAFSVPVINIPTASGTSNQWVTDIYWYGTSPREISSLRGPGVNNWDLNLARTLRVNERAAFEFRLDAYNAFNRVKWANPTAAFGSTNVNDASGAAAAPARRSACSAPRPSRTSRGTSSFLYGCVSRTFPMWGGLQPAQACPTL